MNSGNVFFACSSVPYVWVYVTSGENRTDTNHYTMAKKSLEPCCRLDLVLWWYATSSGHRTISSLFGVGLVQCMWPSVQSCFKGQLIQACHLPAERERRRQKTRDGFAERGYPVCEGAIDGSQMSLLRGMMQMLITIREDGVRLHFKGS